jgi:predicted deacylase
VYAPAVTWRDPEVLQIGGKSIARGETSTIRLEFARLPTGTVIDTRVHVFRGREAGPVLFLQGGLHGDEIGGVEILRRMVRKGSFAPRRGSIVVVPILNVFGFIHFSRDVPDGKDINRSFPGYRRGSLAGRVAYQVSHYLLPIIHCGIDFHTGGARRDNYPQVRYTPDSDEGKQLARAFCAPFTKPTKTIAKSFRRSCHDAGIPIIVYEAGESLGIDETSVKEGINGTLRVLAHLGIHDDAPDRQANSIELAESKWLRAPRSGLFHPTVANGTPVQKGQVVGILGDAYGAREKPVLAHHDGWVICVNRLPVVNQGDALVHIGLSDG